MKYSIVYSILATVIILTPYPASAESDEPVRTISVQGVGSVSAKPDMASINAGVVTRARKPTTALSENTTGKRPKNNKIHEFDRQNP